ncbi:MAG: hypothetical protein LH660_01375 [Phormidesmis sp. CAN_BIN36]|nr:hypothetical protein [Phormidesmis sp. CAN_BIN36]
MIAHVYSLVTISGVAECHYDFPHPQPFSLGRREPKILFPRPLGEGEGEGEFRPHS